MPNYMDTCVVVLMGYMPTTPLFSLNYNTWLPCWLHTLFRLSNPITAQSPGICKWRPPWSPFSSALVMDWYQCYWCPPHMCVAPLYKRAGPPSPLLTFSLNMTKVTPHTNTHQTVGLLNIYSSTCLSADDLHLTTCSPAIAW